MGVCLKPERSHPTASRRSRKELIFSATTGAEHNEIALVDMCLGKDNGFQLKVQAPVLSPPPPESSQSISLWQQGGSSCLFAWLPMLSSMSQAFSCLYPVNKELWPLDVNVLRGVKCWPAFQLGQGCAEGPSLELQLSSRRWTDEAGSTRRVF